MFAPLFSLPSSVATVRMDARLAVLLFQAQVPLVEIGAVLGFLPAAEVVCNPATLRPKNAGILPLEGKMGLSFLRSTGFVLEARLFRSTPICIEDFRSPVVKADNDLFADSDRTWV